VTPESLGVSGISLFSIAFAYMVTTFGPLALSYAVFYWNAARLRSIVAAFLFFVIGVSVYLCKSRSGVLAIGMDMFLVMFFLPRIYPSVRASRTLKLWGVTGAIALMLCVVGSRLVRVETRYSDFSRMKSFSDVERIEIAKAAVEEIRSHPILGMSSAEFVSKHGVAPHNALLNAAIYYGIPGLVLALIGYCVLLKLLLALGKGRNVTTVSWVICGVVMGAVNYCWNGLTHNASFITGGSLLFMLVGLGIAAWDVEERALCATRATIPNDAGGFAYVVPR